MSKLSDNMDKRDETNISEQEKQQNHKVSIKDKLKGRRMSKKRRDEAKNQKWVIDGILPQGNHVVVYGAAGSGKTTVTLMMIADALEDNPDLEAYFLYVDGASSMAAYFEDYIEEKNLSDRYIIMEDGSATDMLKDIEDYIKGCEVPENVIIVIDTLKSLQPDIIAKGALAKTMHRIKALSKQGVSVMTLSHTNKDGENYAGTAEIEQDTDGLLKITTFDGERDYEKISTITAGGRVRFFAQERSFKFTQGKPETVTEIDVIDTTAMKQEKIDMALIQGIRAYLRLKGKVSKTELENAIMEDDSFEHNAREIKKVIKRYIDRFWTKSTGGERNITHFYTIKD